MSSSCSMSRRTMNQTFRRTTSEAQPPPQELPEKNFGFSSRMDYPVLLGYGSTVFINITL